MALPRHWYIALLVPGIILLCARNYATSHYFRDPTSKFFDPKRAYQQIYSSSRRQEAETFVHASATTTFLRNTTSRPLICVGILSVARPSKEIYLRDTVGALLAGLTPHERDAIHLMPFIAHTNTSEHPVYAEPWLHNVADRFLTYNNSNFISLGQFQHVQKLEVERKRTGLPDREKHLFDYVQLLNECEDMKPDYVAIFEDDALALDGWFHRTRNALKEVERQSNMKGGNGCELKNPSILKTSLTSRMIVFYLRLFYTETQLGWNSEEWPTYLSWIIPIVTMITSVQVIIYRKFRKTSLMKLHGNTLFAAGILTTILMTVFFFAAGRASMLPVRYGVHEMPKYGCCAQAIVYPRAKVST